MNAKTIKENLITEDIINVLNAIGSTWYQEDNNVIHFQSVCHNSDSHKLDYFKDSHSFYCYRESQRFDIFSLIQQVDNCDFSTAFKKVTEICNIKLDSYQENNKKIQDDWQTSLHKFVNDQPEEKINKIYNSDILNLFQNKYTQDWINDNISISSMIKYNIMWNEINKSIIIPCYNIDGELIGVRERYTRKQDIVNGKYRPLHTLNETYKFCTSDNLYGIFESKENIKQSKRVFISESEKGCMQCNTYMSDNNICVGTYGHVLSKKQIDILLSLNVEEVDILYDFDYDTVYDDTNKLTQDFISNYQKYVLKAGQKLLPYFKVKAGISYNGHIRNQSPFDTGKDFFENIINNLIELN